MDLDDGNGHTDDDNNNGVDDEDDNVHFVFVVMLRGYCCRVVFSSFVLFKFYGKCVYGSVRVCAYIFLCFFFLP